MEKFITGYQWSPSDGKYIGEYQFPNNLDKEDIHLPPNTTLEKPPVAPAGSAAYRNSETWEIRIDPSQEKTRPPIEDYLLLRESFIDLLKSQGQWNAEDEQKRQDALAAEQARREIADAAMNGGAA